MYLCRTILLKYFTLILVIIFLQTCNARKSKPYYCPPSACGHIRNISYPFHLNTDPKYCGDNPAFELACEGNQTVTSFFSKKLHVQGINYDRKTIHLVDPNLQTQDDLCSLRSQPNFNQYHISNEAFLIQFDISAEPIFMFKCPTAVNSSSTFLEIRGCKFSRYTYIKIGDMYVDEVSDGCRAEYIGLTSLPNITNADNISLSDFHRALLYGFHLVYYPNVYSFGEWTASLFERILWIHLFLLEYITHKYLFRYPEQSISVIQWIIREDSNFSNFSTYTFNSPLISHYNFFAL